MNIRPVQNYQSFKGIWGVRPWDKRANSFHAFKDDSVSIIKEEIALGRKEGVPDNNGEILQVSDDLTIKRDLPFTRAEFLSYKEKNNGKVADLSEKDAEIEDFFINNGREFLYINRNDYTG